MGVWLKWPHYRWGVVVKRAFVERRRTVGEWRRRLPQDFDLAPGRFRKGRQARGCPGRCPHCRGIKLRPKIQTRRAELAFEEWLEG